MNWNVLFIGDSKELPYLFKVSFLTKILEILSMRGEIDNFTQGEI